MDSEIIKIGSIKIGSIWIDKDPREGGRRVRVLATDQDDGGYVQYETVWRANSKPGRKAMSRVRRFRKAFRPLEVSDASH